jgi:hypothetical protein
VLYSILNPKAKTDVSTKSYRIPRRYKVSDDLASHHTPQSKNIPNELQNNNNSPGVCLASYHPTAVLRHFVSTIHHGDIHNYQNYSSVPLVDGSFISSSESSTKRNSFQQR